jgi:DNA-binding transcriptional LysR family regulator
MAEAGHGVAIIPSVLRVRYRVRRLRVTYRGKPLELPMLMNWDKRRTLPAYAKVFCEMVAERVQQTFPIKGKLRRA